MTANKRSAKALSAAIHPCGGKPAARHSCVQGDKHPHLLSHRRGKAAEAQWLPFTEVKEVTEAARLILG